MIRLLYMVCLATMVNTALAADWWPVNALAMPARPEGTVLQNPPSITWPANSQAKGYEVSLAAGQAAAKTFVVADNWLNLGTVLAPGKYHWRVRSLGSVGALGTDWSDSRTFSIGADAQTFRITDAAELIKTAAQRTRPRSLPVGTEWDRLAEALRGERTQDVASLRQRVRAIVDTPLPAEPVSHNTMAAGEAKTRAIGDTRNGLNIEQERILTLGLLWRIDGDKQWLNEGIRRALNLAAWQPTGATGLKSHSQATRTILLSLAVAYDMFYTSLSPAQRAAILSSIRIRYTELYDKIVGSGSHAAAPFDSWASYTLGYLVAVAPLVAGDLPEATLWFGKAFPLYATVFPSWSGDDGGYANGTTYGLWGVPESIVLWDLLRSATGFNLYQKPAIFNFGRLMAYFLPPGSPTGLFGDGAEAQLSSQIAGYGRSFAARAPTPLSDWYAAQLSGEDRSSFVRLTSPPRHSSGGGLPPGTPNSILMESVGWTAMHSALEDRSRVSVYFKSSPFGSHNHSHADQNSFVIHANGRVLATDSGYYDYYDSPHWRNWYKQTRAHNAITFDGGIGQGLGTNCLGSKSRAGKIVRFVQKPDYDLVVGDAAAAYGDQVSTAQRTLIFFRPSTVVVIDRLTSTSPLRWEWNLHTPAALSTNGQGQELSVNGAEMCVDVTSPDATARTSASGYEPPPSMNIAPSPHFANRYAYQSPSRDGLFVSVMRMDCSSAAPLVTFNGRSGTVKIGSRIISVTAGDVIVN